MINSGAKRLKQEDARRVKAAEVKCMKKTAGYKTMQRMHGIKCGFSFGQNAGLQKKLDTTYKHNAS
jgi:hypothetical protein